MFSVEQASRGNLSARRRFHHHPRHHHPRRHHHDNRNNYDHYYIQIAIANHHIHSESDTQSSRIESQIFQHMRSGKRITEISVLDACFHHQQTCHHENHYNLHSVHDADVGNLSARRYFHHQKMYHCANYYICIKLISMTIKIGLDAQRQRQQTRYTTLVCCLCVSSFNVIPILIVMMISLMQITIIFIMIHFLMMKIASSTEIH